MTDLDTRTKLMDAAEHHVRRNGADGFSYADLSAQVGIRKASIHYHFPTKADLHVAIMARYAEGILDLLHAQSAKSEPAASDLLFFLGLYRNALSEGSELCLCVAYAVSRDGLSEATRSEIKDFRAGVLEWLRGCFAKADADGSVASGSPQHEAAALLALVEGAQLAARLGGDVAAFDTATEHFSNRLR